jgi:ribosome-associated heat shock protein Hsp15
MSDQQPVRIDKWLWAARFFKTRALARAAVQGGKVRLNGARVKPSRPLALGDELRIQRGLEELTITVELLSDRRGPATEAQRLYLESEESRKLRAEQDQQWALQRAATAGRERRPDKRQRRQIIRFRNRRDPGSQ